MIDCFVARAFRDLHNRHAAKRCGLHLTCHARVCRFRLTKKRTALVLIAERIVKLKGKKNVRSYELIDSAQREREREREDRWSKKRQSMVSVRPNKKKIVTIKCMLLVAINNIFFSEIH